MIGLIKKDLFLIKSNFKSLFLILFIFVIMSIQGQIDLSFLISFICITMMISTFSYDNYNNWDAYSITLPNGRINTVKAKYITTIIVVLISTIIVTVFSFLITFIKTQTIDFEYTFSMMLGSNFAIAILMSFMYPIIYKFGIEKARIAIVLIVFTLGFGIGLISKYFNLSLLTKIFSLALKTWFITLPVIAILLIYLSYKISEQICLKKEF